MKSTAGLARTRSAALAERPAVAAFAPPLTSGFVTSWGGSSGIRNEIKGLQRQQLLEIASEGPDHRRSRRRRSKSPVMMNPQVPPPEVAIGIEHGYGLHSDRPRIHENFRLRLAIPNRPIQESAHWI